MWMDTQAAQNEVVSILGEPARTSRTTSLHRAIASTFPRDPVAVIIRGQRAGAVGEIGDGTPRKLQKRPATGWKQEQGDTSRWRNAGRRISRKQQLGFARVTNKLPWQQRLCEGPSEENTGVIANNFARSLAFGLRIRGLKPHYLRPSLDEQACSVFD
ncbi:uncharacterized protein LOC9642618 [Selaginella moellendorffii]|uniref:uncharacterized protein LOC9642618 n=1 Tax=Selaginella moellendorffii TaxID=88036 RepID=UPI000D1CF6CF|nr:uncharacterized protein LOC9642618 [Selaginella moellendorffii]|eukprot:XP_024534428.1 uncharacterized protein LOC9642618 [Selaginella moellendorffii]